MDKTKKISPEEKKKADAFAAENGNDLACAACDVSRPFKAMRYRRNRSGDVLLTGYKLLSGWKGRHCPECQEKLENLERERLAKIKKKRDAQIAANAKEKAVREKKHREEQAKQQADLLRKIDALAKSKATTKKGA